MKPDSFIPGFADQLLGAKAGDRGRSTSISRPIRDPALARRAFTKSKVVEMKEKIVPGLDEAFAKLMG